MSSPVTLAAAIRQAAIYQIGNIHTALPGAIISYDYTTQKASIQPLLNKAWSDGSETPMPVLNNVPVIWPRAGGASLTFPVAEGDTCLLLFIERSTDLWKTVGGQVTPDDGRKYDLSDGVAIMGLFPFSETSQATNNEDVLLTYNNSSLTIKANGDIVINTAGKVAIGNVTTELLQVLSDTLALLASATAVPAIPSGGSPPQPLTIAAAATTLQTALDAIKGTIP